MTADEEEIKSYNAGVSLFKDIITSFENTGLRCVSLRRRPRSLIQVIIDTHYVLSQQLEQTWVNYSDVTTVCSKLGLTHLNKELEGYIACLLTQRYSQHEDFIYIDNKTLTLSYYREISSPRKSIYINESVYNQIAHFSQLARLDVSQFTSLSILYGARALFLVGLPVPRQYVLNEIVEEINNFKKRVNKTIQDYKTGIFD